MRRALFSPQCLSLICLFALLGCNNGNPPQTPSGKEPMTATTALFRDVAESAGLKFELSHNGRHPLTILETLGNGAGFLDYDNDGWLDAVLVGPDKVVLFHNEKNGKFTDVTAQSGLKQGGNYWQGCAAGDYDNDGKVDLYVSGYRCAALYRNVGGGTPNAPKIFEEVTGKAGVASKLWGTSAAFVDVDQDGFLDLFVANYVKFFPTSTQYCAQNGIKTTCGPTHYDPERGVLYHNNRNGTFTDETKKRGLQDAQGNALGVAIADYDNDGWVDIAIANDQTPGDLYRNKGKGFFENVGEMSGTAYDVNGTAHAGMGLDWGDIYGDGRFGLFVTAYQHQTKSLYIQNAPGLFSDMTHDTGLGKATVNNVAFGAKLFDYNNDGLPDILISNGHAMDNVELTDSTTTYPQVTQLFENRGKGKFEERTEQAGKDLLRKIVGRGLATGDYDNDGRVDALIVDIEGKALLLHNEVPNQNHWLIVKLQGTQSARDGNGAHLTLEASGKKWRQVASTGGSFMSANDPRAHIGLGSANKLERLTVHWANGKSTVVQNVPADQIILVTEGKAGYTPLKP